MQKLVTQAKFAEISGVNKSTVNRIMKKSLKPAVVEGFIDLGNDLCKKYLEKKGVDYEHLMASVTTSAIKKENKAKLDTAIGRSEPKKIELEPVESEFSAVSEPEADNEITMYTDMRLGDVVDKFGTDERFLTWLKAVKEIENIQEKRLKNEATRGTLINRQIVKDHVIDPFNAAHLKMMKDGAKTIAIGAVSKHETGAGEHEIEAYVSGIIGSFVKPVKAKVSRTLRNA